MNSDKNTNTRESTSNGRRVSSILKRQDSCVASEGTDGSGECPRTPRRVSFATTAAVMRYFPDNMADESCASAGSNSDSSAASPGSSLNADQDSVIAPPPCPPAQIGYEGEMASGMNLTNESPESHPDVLVQAVSMFQQDVTINSHRGPMKEGGLSPAKQSGTILCTSLNESECSIDLTANVPQIFSAVSRQDDENEASREYISGKQQETQNRTILFSNMDEYGCCMDITSNLSESLFQENNENYHQDISFRKGQTQARPGLNRVPSFADEQTYESEDDRAFIEGDANIAQQNVPDRTVIFSNKNGEEMELTEYLEEPVTCSSHTGKDVYENMIVKPKPKTLDDLFKLVKKQESSFVADCSEEDFTTLDPEDMEITGEQSRVVPRAALSDIITRKALTPIEEVSLISSNVSMADQDSHFRLKPSYTLQPHTAVSKLNLEQMLSVQHSSRTADFVFEKAFISPQNKENYPVLCHDYKILAGQNIPAGASKYAGNISLGIASHSSRRKSNKSFQDVSIKECQTGKVHMGQESNETPRIKAIIPSQLGSRINPDQNRVNYNLQQDEGKTGLDYPYNYVPIIENNCKDDTKLQRRMEEWDGTALFKDVESMKFVTSNTRTADVGQYLGYGKELKDCILSFDSSEVEMTKCLSKTIEIDGNKQKYLRPVDECSDERTHVCDNSLMEMTKCLSETVEFDKNKQKSLRSESECSDQRTHVCDNSLMEMTKCLSKTIEVDGNKQKSLKSESGYSDERTRVCDNSLMEMTKCLSKTIEVDGNKQKSLKSESGCSDERTRVCDNSLMEITKCLTKTIEFNGNMQKNFRPESECLYQRTRMCDDSLMEMTKCLSKTIEVDGNKQKILKSESGCSYERTRVCDSSLMEMTKCLSKTIEVDGNKQKILKSESGYSDERTRVCDNSLMEMTKCLSKTIEVDGSKQKILKSESGYSDERTHVCDNSLMEMTKCLTKTIEFNGNMQKNFRPESECLDQRTRMCDDSLMEMTKCLSKTIEVDGNKQKSLKSESGCSDERTRVCDSSLMEMTKCLSKTIEVDGSKQKSLKSESGYSDERTRVCDNSLMEMTKCLTKTIEFNGNMQKNFRPESECLDQRTCMCDDSLMEMTKCLSKTIEVDGNKQKILKSESGCSDEGTRVCDNSLMEMTKCLSKTIEVDGNKQKILKSESGCSDERTRICDNSLMEMTGSQARTIHIESKPNERAEIFSGNPVNANENKVYILNSSHVDLPAFPVNFSSKAVPRDHSEASQILNNFATEIKECTSNVTSCGQIASSEIRESCKVQSAVGPYTVNNDTSYREVSGCIIEKPKRLKLSVDQAKNEIFVSSTDRCSIPIQNTPFQSDFTAAEYNDMQYSNLHQNIGDNFSVLLDTEKLESQFSIGNRGVEDSLQCNTGTNIKFRKKDIVCDQETVMRDAEKIAESGQQMVSLQENATRIVDHKHEALRQALSKDLGLSLSLSKKPLNIFDPLQRRKSCNFDLVLGKGNKGQMKIYQFPLISQMNSNRAASMSSEVSDKRDSPTSDLTDMSAVLEQTKGLPTFIYDHLSNSSLSESLATATSAKPRLKEALSLDKDSILLGPSSTASSSELVSSGGAANFHTSSSSCEDVLTEAVETLSNQEMPKLIEGTPDYKLMERSLEFDEDSILSDLNIISMMDPAPFNMQDLYEVLGISRLKKAPVKSMPFQNVPRTTVKENLLAKVLDAPRFSCLKQHVNEVEATVNRSKQECKDKSKEFYHKLPDPLQALLSKESRNNVPDLKMKAVEMVSACRTSAKAMWIQHKADYLMKYSDARESARHALDCETEKVISATEKIDGLIASIDKCLGEVEEIFNRKQELMKQEKDLKEAEMAVKELKLQCKEMDDRVISLEKLNKEAAELIINIETGQEDAKEKLSCMFSLAEWTIMEKTKSWIHFGFLYGTIILQVHLEDSGSSCQKISRITLHSRLGEADSRPWAKLTHNMAMSSIDCKSLHVLYRSHDQIHELLTDVSAIASDCRQLSTELKHAHLKHRLTVDGNRLKFVVSNRKTRQQVRLDTSVVENSCLHLPLEWNVTTLLGNVSSHAVKSAIEKVHGRHMYITRVLSEVEQQLARYKQR